MSTNPTLPPVVADANPDAAHRTGGHGGSLPGMERSRGANYDDEKTPAMRKLLGHVEDTSGFVSLTEDEVEAINNNIDNTTLLIDNRDILRGLEAPATATFGSLPSHQQGLLLHRYRQHPPLLLLPRCPPSLCDVRFLRLPPLPPQLSPLRPPPPPRRCGACLA